MQRISAASARVARVWRALFAPNLRSFSVENRAIFALKFLKVSAIAAADARRTHIEYLNSCFMHAEQDAKVFLSSAVLCAAHFAENFHDFRSKSRKFR